MGDFLSLPDGPGRGHAWIQRTPALVRLAPNSLPLSNLPPNPPDLKDLTGDVVPKFLPEVISPNPLFCIHKFLHICPLCGIICGTLDFLVLDFVMNM